MTKETKEIERQRIYSGFLNLDRVTYKRGDSEFKREIIDRGDAVCGVLFNTATQKYVFVKQFRPAANEEMLEVVAGTMDVEGESAENCFKREVLEETGFVVIVCNLIYSGYSSPGTLTEKMYIFQATTDGTKGGTGGGVGNESIEIVEYTREEIEKYSELFKDLKTFVALSYEFTVGQIPF